MTLFVISKFDIDFVGSEKALNGNVAFPPYLDL